MITMESQDQEQVKESRTDRLLRRLGLTADFKDPLLPKETFSHSQYFSWLVCGAAYEKKYVEGVETPNYPSTTKGTAVHAGAEFMLRGKMDGDVPSIEQGIAALEASFAEKAQKVLKWEEDMPEGKVKDEAIAVFKTFATQALPLINPIAVEKGFAKKVGDVPMIGYIDLVDEQPAMDTTGMDEVEVLLAPKKRITVDFKTGRAKWSDNELRTDTQMTLYSDVEGTPDVRVDQLISLKKGPVYIRGESVRTPEDVAILTEHINEVAGLIKKGVFPKAPIDHWSCNEKHCSYWSMCRGKKR